MFKKFINIFVYIISIFFITLSASSEELSMKEILEIIQKDLRTLERAVDSGSNPLSWSKNRRSVTVKAN